MSRLNGDSNPMSDNGFHTISAPLAIFYEHPSWYAALFDELDRRGMAYDRQLAFNHRFDPNERETPYALIFNRMSPSAFSRGHENAIPYTLQYLSYLKNIGANVVNGYDTYLYEFSKANQCHLLGSLGIRHPRSRVINHLSQAVEASEGLTFPIITKANIGGSGAGIQKFDTPEALRHASVEGTIEMGLDHVALIQEYLPPRGNKITRVEVLGGKFLYAIQVNLVSPDSFNLCPGSYCQRVQESSVCATGESGSLILGYTPPQEIIETIERIAAASHLDVGGIEYLINDRDGEIYYYDINAMSNFVANATHVVGFEPLPLLVDYLVERAGLNQETAAYTG